MTSELKALTENYRYVKVTFRSDKKRPWRVTVGQCQHCAETWVGETLEKAVAAALARMER